MTNTDMKKAPMKSGMITPQERYLSLADAVGLPDMYFKREDLHPYGSHKGRSIPLMIDHYVAKGKKTFAISSSGNAALAAALHAKKLGTIELDIFVGNHVVPKKLDKIKKLATDKIRVLIKERPLQALSQAANDGAVSLRQSTDDVALEGYESLARELATIKKLSAVFIGTSSGTTAQALARYFVQNKLAIQVHIVQTSSCHPLTDAFETFDFAEEKSVADAIVDKTAYRRKALVPLIEKTGGRGWLATNDTIRAAQDLVSKHTKIDISPNSALAVVGAMQAAYIGYEIEGAVACVICGD